MGLDPKDQAWEDHLTKIGVLPSYRPTYPGREEFDAGWDAVFTFLGPKSDPMALENLRPPVEYHVRVSCTCQRSDPPAIGCALCEGDCYRTVTVNTETRTISITNGVYPATEIPVS